MSYRSAVLIMEGPWNLDDGDRNRSSVLPFFEGMAKQFSDVDIVHSRYYDLHSFRVAFDELTSHHYDEAIVYVAGHGDGSRVSGARILDILVSCNVGSRRANITGVMLGACFSAGPRHKPLGATINTLIQDSSIAWIAAYRSAALWFESTQIDLAIVRGMLLASQESFDDRLSISRSLADSISCFSPTFGIGHDSLSDRGEPVPLKNGLAFFSQPRGQGQRSREVTDEVWTCWDACQLAVNDCDEI